MTNKKQLMFFGQWAILILLVVLITLLEWEWAYYVLGVFAVLVIFVRVLSFRNEELIIEISCDPQKYLDQVEKRTKEKDDIYHLQMAYGLIHQELFDEAITHFDQVVFESIKNQKRYAPIYIRTRARVYYYKKDLESLIKLVTEVSEDKTLEEEILMYVKVFRLLVEERTEDAIDSLKNAIPVQQYRLHIYELEYFLCECYYALEQYVDSAYVGDFISEKQFKLIYVDKCREIAFESKKHLDDKE